MITKNDLERLTNGLNLLENTETKDRLINTFSRLKQETPFSIRLNSIIEEWFENHKQYFVFVDEDDFDGNDIEGTFQKHMKRFSDERVIHIWTGASDNTIFGNPTVNHKFRAWHDYIHITRGFGYDYLGESIVCDIQKNMLPQDLTFEKELVHVEIVGQAQYFMLNKEFLSNQRKFTIDYLISPFDALKINSNKII